MALQQAMSQKLEQAMSQKLEQAMSYYRHKLRNSATHARQPNCASLLMESALEV